MWTQPVDTDLGDEATAVTAVETEAKAKLSFIYLLRPGPCETTPASHFKPPSVHLCWAVIQFIASNRKLYNLQMQLRSEVIDSPAKVTSACLWFIQSTPACVALSK